MADEREPMPVQDEASTTVPAAYFDELLADLALPAQPNDALVRAAERARRRVIGLEPRS